MRAGGGVGIGRRRGGWRRGLKLGLLGLLAIGLAAGAALGVYAWRSLPQTDGAITLSAPGAAPRAAVTIERDAAGIPTIRAVSRDDALFGLGYAHAQDRLWQMETQRRIGAGRLAEAFGAPAVATDRFLRALGVRRAAAAQWAAAGPDLRAALTAYTAGVNAFLRDGLKARPPEFVVLGLHPEPWDPVDSLAWTLMMAWDLGGNWSAELLRMRLALRLPVDRVNELLPPYPGDKPLVTAKDADYAALYRDLKVAAAPAAPAAVPASAPVPRPVSQALPLPPMPPAVAALAGLEGIGSNNWVVHGTRTASGLPLLANDPHLKLGAPALWYLARLAAPGFTVAGATLPGLPIVVLGQNHHIAWGFTNTGPDVQDLYLEQVDPADPARYRTPDGTAPFETVTETIKVKGGADVTVALRRTRHGPVISDAPGIADDLLGGAPGGPRYVLAMRWTALDADAGSLDVGLVFNTARSVDDFIAASKPYAAPMQSMVVADRDGRIGMVAPGRVPVRRADHDLKGLVPAPGWDARYDWAGFIPPDRTPRTTDAARGWIATANQKIVADDYAPFLTSEWMPPYRHQRIEALLAARPKHDVASLRAIQADELSLATVRLLSFVRRARSTHPLADAAQQRLAAFDGTMAANAAAPLIFVAWARQLTEGVFADEMGAALYARVSVGRSFRDALEGVLERDDGWWCDDKTTPAVAETCAQQIDAAFGRTLDELQAAHGADVAAWRWGDAHVARSEHRPFSKVAPLARFFELRVPAGGDGWTVNAARYSLAPDATTGERYLDEHGPSLRALYDLADPRRSRFVQSSGQSGNVFSPHYRDFVARWARVDDLPLWPEGAPERTLVIGPAPGTPPAR